MVAGMCGCYNTSCGSTCPCTKAKVICTAICHGAKPWANVPCLNTSTGLKVKEMKPAEVIKAVCDAGLSPIGTNVELRKRLAVHYTKLSAGKEEGTGADGGSGSSGSLGCLEDLMEAINANEGDFAFILSLSGKIVKATSSKAELRKAYFILSSKVHPDKNSNSPVSKKAFQAVLESFERLANPEKFDETEKDDDKKPARKRKKMERFTRGNEGCFLTRVRCPRCTDTWNRKDLGLEDAAYNFLMQGVKQYICGGCFFKFGCMTAIHECPFCWRTFEYDPDDYHRKITCGNKKCDETFGFWMFKVSEIRERQIRIEVKAENEAIAKTRAQQRRRSARADKRIGTLTNEERVKEQLFVLGLLDDCPKCGWLLEKGMHLNDAKNHLNNCDDQKQIKAYQRELAEKKAKQIGRKKAEETQEEMQAFKTWEFNGRQVGQLWMLSENILKRECKKYNLDTDDPKHVLISKLGRVIRDRERKMITMGGENHKSTHDITPIHKVDAEDLPANMESMETEDLQCVAASYGLDFDHSSDVKVDLLKKLETARFKGTGLLMILDDQSDKKKRRIRKSSESDPEFEVNEVENKDSD